jgi:hypothetical protein
MRVKISNSGEEDARLSYENVSLKKEYNKYQ